MRLDRRTYREITLAILNAIEPNYSSMSRENQIFLFNNMKKAVHKFVVKEYNRRQSILKTRDDAI